MGSGVKRQTSRKASLMSSTLGAQIGKPNLRERSVISSFQNRKNIKLIN